MPRYTGNVRLCAEERDGLRRIAMRRFHSYPADHTLQPKAFGNEAFLEIARQGNVCPLSPEQRNGVPACR